MNTIQRKILIVVALAIGAMLLFPPFLCQSNGIGYAFIFSETGKCWGNPGAINAAQLVVQWIGVASIGAIVFVLAKDYQPKDGAIRATTATVFGAVGLARQRAMIWLWAGLGAFIGKMLYAYLGNHSGSMVGAIGIAGVGLLLFAASLTWHTARILYMGPVAALATPKQTTNWRRVLVVVLVAIALLVGLYAWNRFNSNELTFDDAAIQSVPGKSTFEPDK